MFSSLVIIFSRCSAHYSRMFWHEDADTWKYEWECFIFWDDFSQLSFGPRSWLRLQFLPFDKGHVPVTKQIPLKWQIYHCGFVRICERKSSREREGLSKVNRWGDSVQWKLTTFVGVWWFSWMFAPCVPVIIRLACIPLKVSKIYCCQGCLRHDHSETLVSLLRPSSVAGDDRTIWSIFRKQSYPSEITASSLTSKHWFLIRHCFGWADVAFPNGRKCWTSTLSVRPTVEPHIKVVMCKACSFLYDLLQGRAFPGRLSDPTKGRPKTCLSLRSGAALLALFLGKLAATSGILTTARFRSSMRFLVCSPMTLDRARWCPRQTEIRWTWRPSVNSPRSWLRPSPALSTLPRSCPCSRRSGIPLTPTPQSTSLLLPNWRV